MPTPELSGWRKSSRSGPNNGNCVEIGFSTDATFTGVRDTKDRTYGTLVFDRQQWAAFVAAVKADDLSA
ncbi:DUF397 domain-containing protein [Saccharopolyspora sp. NPDC002376]